MSPDDLSDPPAAERVLEGVELLDRLLEVLERDPEARDVFRDALIDLPPEWLPRGNREERAAS